MVADLGGWMRPLLVALRVPLSVTQLSPPLETRNEKTRETRVSDGLGGVVIPQPMTPTGLEPVLPP